jgi:hypothetical protein
MPLSLFGRDGVGAAFLKPMLSGDAAREPHFEPGPQRQALFKLFKPSIRPNHSGGDRVALGLYSYRFDSQTARSRGFTLTVVGRNE